MLSRFSGRFRQPVLQIIINAVSPCGCRRPAILGFILTALLFYVFSIVHDQAASGIGGQGAGNIFVQCVFKSFWSQDTYTKSGKQFSKVTEVLSQEGIDNGYFAYHFPTDKEDLHNYTRYYDTLFAPYVVSSHLDSTHFAILEVGVKKGGSLKMWRELFGWNSFIYGVDIDPGVPTFIRDAHIKTLVFDSRDGYLAGQSLRGLEFDVIIDDGDHDDAAQKRTLTALWPFLKSDGIYVIEDLGTGKQTEDIWLGFAAKDGATWSRHIDKSGQHVAFIYPKESKAPPILDGCVTFP